MVLTGASRMLSFFLVNFGAVHEVPIFAHCALWSSTVLFNWYIWLAEFCSVNQWAQYLYWIQLTSRNWALQASCLNWIEIQFVGCTRGILNMCWKKITSQRCTMNKIRNLVPLQHIRNQMSRWMFFYVNIVQHVKVICYDCTVHKLQRSPCNESWKRIGK